jgi:VPS28 protein
MDALKLRMRAKDQLHPLLQELVTSFSRFKGSKDWEGRSRMVGWRVNRYRRVLLIHLCFVGSLRLML